MCAKREPQSGFVGQRPLIEERTKVKLSGVNSLKRAPRGFIATTGNQKLTHKQTYETKV